MRAKLIIIWSTGEREEYVYSDKLKALQAERNMKLCFGNQITWSGIC